MALFKSRSKTWEGVWLLKGDALLALDEILQKHWKDLGKRRKRQINDAVAKQRAELEQRDVPPEKIEAACEKYKRELTDDDNNHKLQIKIDIGESKTVKVESMADALKSEELKDFKPRGFSIHVESGSDRINLGLDSWLLTSGSRMSLSVSPSNLLGGSAFYDLEKWADSNRLHYALSWWARHTLLLNLVLAVLAVVLWIEQSVIRDLGSREPLREEATQLAKEGVTQQTTPRAVQLLLEHTFHVGRTEAVDKITPLSFAPLVIPLLLVLTWLHPKSALAIGKGKQSLKVQEWWIWLLVRGLIGIVFLSTLAAIFRALVAKSVLNYFGL